MRPLRFVALSEDGQALILTDEVGRMLFLALDDSVLRAIRHDQNTTTQVALDVDASLTPRDIQARIRAGDSVAEVARVANVAVEKVLRFAGPVLQERAAMAEFARRTRLKTDEQGRILGEIADKRLSEHGVDTQMVAWDAFRRETGTWRITASWQSGKSTAHAEWDLDKARSAVTAVDEMAQFLIGERSFPTHTKTSGDVAHLPTESDPHQANEDNQQTPIVPAVSMLRRERNGRAHRAVERPGMSRWVHGEERSTSQALSAIDTGVAPGIALPVLPPASADADTTATAHQDQIAPNPDQDQTAGAPKRSAAEVLGLTTPGKPRKRTLPSWDDILFGSSD